MELTWDWKSFQNLFHARRKVPLPANRAAPVYLVMDGDRIVSAHCEGEETSEWVGRRISEVEKEFAHRDRVVYGRESVDAELLGALEQPHYQDQIEYLRARVRPSVSGSRSVHRREVQVPVNRHFLLHGLQTWWSRVFPSSYGVFVRLELAQGAIAKDFLVVVRRGRLDAFLEPDLSSMGAERSRMPAEVVRYLSERYHVPVQGLIARKEDWDHWSEHGNPWPAVAKALRSEHAKLVPFHWGLATMIGARAFLGL